MSNEGRGVEPHLARLRRHARAMAGSQLAGDAHVSALLDMLRADPGLLSAMPCRRVGLFKLCNRLLNDRPDGGGMATTPPPQPIRQALLLTAVERFSLDEAAEIMEITSDEVEGLLDAARRSLKNLGGADVMIIESEPLIALNIQQTVRDLGLRVNSMPPSPARALTLLGRDRPDLIIADGGSHADMVEELYTSHKTPVVFISAYPEMFLTGRRPEPVFVAEKPFYPAEIKALIFQALFFAQGAPVD